MRKQFKSLLQSVLEEAFGDFLGKFFLLVFAFALLLQAIPAKEVTVIYDFPLNSTTADIKETATVADDANAFSAFAKAASNNSLALDVSYFDFDDDGIRESAFINAVNGISTSADFSKYWQFSINNKPAMTGISAFAPNNGDTISLDYFEGANTDALEWLVDKQKSNGSIGNNIFQDAFALMGLSLSWDNNVSASNATNKSKNYLLGQQGHDGGFGNDLYTAAATMALLSSGKDLNNFAVSGKTSIELLKEHQLADGGFKSGTNESDVDTSAWATIAIAQAGKELPEKNNYSPVNYLLSAQHANGGFGYNASDSTESIDFTEEAIIALSAALHPKDQNVLKALDWLSSKQNTEGCISDGFRTALGSIAFRALGENEKSEKAANCLKTLQNGDGSFGRSSNASNAMDTGIAIIALSNAKFPLTTPQTDTNEEAVGINSIVKFLVEIKNNGIVKAQNVNVSLEGIPADWVFSDAQGSTSHFDEIKTGETKTAEIFAKLKSHGSFSVKAIVTTDQASSPSNSNSLFLNINEALLGVSIRIA